MSTVARALWLLRNARWGNRINNTRRAWGRILHGRGTNDGWPWCRLLHSRGVKDCRTRSRLTTIGWLQSRGSVRLTRVTILHLKRMATLNTITGSGIIIPATIITSHSLKF